MTLSWKLSIAGTLVVIAVVGSAFFKGLRQAPAYAADPTYDAEERVEWWIKSADCMRRTGVFLAICGPSDSRVYPIEDFSLADDRGHAFVADLWARGTNKPFDRIGLTELNLSINALGILLLAFMFWFIGMPYTALLCGLLGAHYGIPGPIPGPDSPSSYIGVLALALIPSVWLSAFYDAAFSNRKRVSGSIISLFSLFAAAAFRQPIGFIGWSCCFLLLLGLYFSRQKKSLRLAAVCAIGMAGACTAIGASSILIAIRNKLYTIPPAVHVQAHGLSHALYVGLGVVPNPWGIQWKDTDAINVVHQIDPQAIYCSPRYFQILRNLYWHLVWTHPLQIAGIYKQKLIRTLAFPIRLEGLPLYWILLAAGGMGVCLWKKSLPEDRRPLRVMFAIALFIVIFILQGVLGIPWGKYLYPAKFAVLLALCSFSDYALRRGLSGRLAGLLRCA